MPAWRAGASCCLFVGVWVACAATQSGLLACERKGLDECGPADGDLGRLMNGIEKYGAYCTDDEDHCTFSCPKQYSCIKAQLFCGGFTGGDRDDVHAMCKADCTGGEYSCERAQLFCGQDHDCMLTTSYGQSMEVTCPNNASLPPSMDRLSCSVECKDRQYACE